MDRCAWLEDGMLLLGAMSVRSSLVVGGRGRWLIWQEQARSKGPGEWVSTDRKESLMWEKRTFSGSCHFHQVSEARGGGLVTQGHLCFRQANMMIDQVSLSGPIL